MKQGRDTLKPTAASLVLLMLTAVCLTGFAPFNSEGLAIFRIADGEGLAPGDAQADGLTWRDKETPALVHTLSSRFGGGGALIYMEYLTDKTGVSGLLLIDLRHAGIPDFETTLIDVPERRRVEVHFQEWTAQGDTFISERGEGDVQILDMYRGERVSAVAVSFNLTFLAPGPDGALGTNDDRWRRVEGRATTSPTVEEAVEIEADVVFERRESGRQFEPDGNIYVTCVGDAYVEEEPYDEESYTYEDDEGGGCEGDTWEDDTTDPQESGGCAGETVVDDGEPNADGGCEGTDDLEDPDDDESEDTYYDDDDYESDSGCDGDTDDSTTDTSSTDDSSTSDDDTSDDSGCEGDVEASLPPGERSRLRRYLLSKGPCEARAPCAGHKLKRHRFDKETRRTMRRIFSYAPFFLLGLFIHGWRRRAGRV